MRLLVLVILCAITAPAFADEPMKLGIGLPIQVVIIQCGTQSDARRLCESNEEARCCAVIDPSYDEDKNPLLSGLDGPNSDMVEINDSQYVVLN